MKPIVAIVGRPNAGKSTFFNRITRTRDALVDDYPGVTRDRHYGEAVWRDASFMAVDTGGFSTDDADPFAGPVRDQVKQAVADADIVVMLLDGKGGFSPFDADLAALLRAAGKPVFYAVNKIDGEDREDRLSDFYRLGVGPLHPVSAEHGYGVPDFLDVVTASFPSSEPELPENLIRVAVVGRPNGGKSSLINRILGENRLVVSETPGTTRDAVDTRVVKNGRTYCLVDTAGIRRKGKVGEKVEKFSIIKALKSLDRCDVALIVLDASEGVTDQDISIAGYAYERGCGCIFLLNKWDLADSSRNAVKRQTEALRMKAKFLSFAPVLTVSALQGLRVQKIFGLIDDVYSQYASRITTGQLNRVINDAVLRTEPPLHKGKRLKFYYAAQVSQKPPTFVCFVNYPEAVHFSYHRYLTNQIREGAGLTRTPLRLLLRQRTGHIDFGARKAKRFKIKK